MSESLETVDAERFQLIWKIVEEIGVQERHFNELQSGYRNMASAWLGATFAGFGFVATHTLGIPVDRELLVAGVAAAGAVGIGLLWVLDLLVYHRLLQSCFVEGLVLEKNYPWMPPVRHNMWATQRHVGVIPRVVGFYLVPISLLILIAGGSVSLWADHRLGTLAASLCAVATIAAAALAGRFVQNKTASDDGLGPRLKAAFEA